MYGHLRIPYHTPLLPIFNVPLVSSPQIELPPWHDLVKTAAYKEMCPFDADWYYVRAASIARHIYLRGGVGVGGFKKRFGEERRFLEIC